jgi:hypothetical protein
MKRRKERQSAYGRPTTVVTVGGPILGGALADAGLWRYIFFINLPIGALSLLILWRKVGESKDEGSSGGLDFAGSLAIALGLALLTFWVSAHSCGGVAALGDRGHNGRGVIAADRFSRYRKAQPESYDAFTAICQ